ncbi:MAG TPA: DNA repair protein RecN [Actinomycetota bacterium]|nr:DNA repair protein RecN [Actinomycetota bacterium]
MLQELHVRDLGVIAEASVSFGPGLNVITGETGAGKTLLMTCLGLLAGARADPRLVAAGADQALVQAVMSAAAGGPDTEGGELIVARRISPDGKSRAWLDGRLVPASVLADAVGELVEVHSQGSGFALARPAVQMQALDSLAGTGDLLREYRAVLSRLRESMDELRDIREGERLRAREQEFLSFQVREIDAAALDDGEDEAVRIELGRLENAERLTLDGQRVVSLTGSDGAAAHLTEAAKVLRDASALDPSVQDVAERMSALGDEVSEAAREVRAWAEGIEPDPARLESLRDRAALISSLGRKYGATVADIKAAAESARRELASLESADARTAGLDESVVRLESELGALGAELSKRRAAAAADLTAMVNGELGALALGGCSFEASCEASGTHSDRGADRVEFRFSSDSRRPPEPIGKVASGGELSRAMIAVTLALASAHHVPVLVFDEADQGVGGAAALEVARRLARLGRTHQVLVVSHLPQIAAYADCHVAVRRHESGVRVETLQDDGRIAEISRMLAGLDSSDRARAHAEELVSMARRERDGRPAAKPRSRRAAATA